MALAFGAVAPTAAAQGVIIQADGAVNVGYTETSQTVPAPPDPNPQPADVRDSSVGRLLTELRPGISLQFGSPRLTWRAAYVFSGALSIDSGQSLSYSNQANLSLGAQLTKFTLMTLTGNVAQGGTSFLLAEQPAEMGKPAIRAPGNPDLVSASAVEALAWQAAQRWMVQQSLSGALSAPQSDLGARNSQLTGTLALEHLWGRDTVGLEARSGIARLRQLEAKVAPYSSVTGAILGRWNHDYTWKWNALVTAGGELVFTDTGSRPLALLPTGSATVRYTAGKAVGSLEALHGSATNLQVGTVSLTDQITGRGIFTLNADKLRVLSFSAGLLHNEPIGEARLPAGTGNAVQGDAGFTTAITKGLLGTARYSVAYQYGQVGSLGPSLIHIFLVGVTGSISNTSKVVRPVPTLGQRVDGSDGQGFTNPDAPIEDTGNGQDPGNRQDAGSRQDATKPP